MEAIYSSRYMKNAVVLQERVTAFSPPCESLGAGCLPDAEWIVQSPDNNSNPVTDNAAQMAS